MGLTFTLAVEADASSMTGIRNPTAEDLIACFEWVLWKFYGSWSKKWG